MISDSELRFNAVKVPAFGDIRIIGPILSDSTIFLYMIYAAIMVQVACSAPAGGLE